MDETKVRELLLEIYWEIKGIVDYDSLVWIEHEDCTALDALDRLSKELGVPYKED